MAQRLPDETRAAILADLALGHGVREVARRHGVGHPTVIALRDQHQPVAVVGPVQQQTIGERLEQLMHEQLETLLEQQRVAREPDWIRRQNAHDLAIWQGVQLDKLARLIGAWSRGRMAELPGPGGAGDGRDRLDAAPIERPAAD